MALAPINPTQLTPPRVAFIDERSGAISREWYRFFLSLLTATQTNQDEAQLAPDTSSLLATYDAMLASATQTSAIASDGMVASLESNLNNLQNAFGVTPPDLGGTVTSVAASGGTTGLTFTGSPITTSGTLTLGGTLAVASGGTGQTSYTNGQLLIGNTTGNTLTPAALTAGTNISITNGAGAITINATYPFVGTVTSVGQTFTGGLISVAGSPITTSGTLALAVAGTSGGIVYFSSATTWATSAALAASAIVLGGGAGAAPATTTTGTGVVTALGVNTGTAGAFVVNGGVLGTPSSGTVTNLTGTASININGTVGATTATTGAFTTITGSTSLTTPLISGGTAAASTLILQSTSGAGTTDFIAFRTASQTEQMRIDSSGNVGIGTAAPNASAILDVQSTTKGFRLPNMTTVQKNAVATPAAGLMVFDTTLAKACVYSGAAWETITSI
jgi:hypothetical protein